MKQAVIHNLPYWRVTSHGNGLAYEVERKPTGETMFFQGADADEFREELTALTEGTPTLGFSEAITVLWHDRH